MPRKDTDYQPEVQNVEQPQAEPRAEPTAEAPQSAPQQPVTPPRPTIHDIGKQPPGMGGGIHPAVTAADIGAR